MRILVADDDPISRHLLQAVLASWGYEVAAAADGDEAWQVLQGENAPQLAILDWEMPGMEGPAVCRSVRERTGGAYTYVILLTARSAKDDLIAGMEAGADDYLTKPFDAAELRVRLRAGRRILDLEAALLQAQEGLRIQATQDPLTGLSNRGTIMDVLARELSRGRVQSQPVAVMMLDLDHFKKVNDTYGHPAGDQVLRDVARRLRSVLRAYDAVGRYGGEEFILVLPGCDLANGAKLAERLREAVGGGPVDTTEGLIGVTVSIGVAAADPHAALQVPEYAQAVVRAADQALYQAKNAGRNCVQLALPSAGASI